MKQSSEIKKRVHFVDSYLLNPSHPITVHVIGAGGTGSQVVIGNARRLLGSRRRARIACEPHSDRRPPSRIASKPVGDLLKTTSNSFHITRRPLAG